MTPPIRISAIAAASPKLELVKQLGRKYSATLGWFPNGAYEEHADKGHLFIAEEGDVVVGYVAFRISKGRAMIAHLCVAKAFNKRGVARLLADEVKALARSQDLRGVGLHCRRDYPSTTLWPRLGFVPRGTKQGRGVDAVELTFWWFDLHPRDLFSELEQDDGRLQAVIDNNVFRDLHDAGEIRNEEAQYLLADWLTGQLELCIVDELFVELNRLPLEMPREDWIREARQYRELVFDQTKADAVYRELKVLFKHPEPDATQESDMRFVAKAATAQADILLTRDKEILDHAEDIEAKYGLQVVRPVDLIARLDEAERAAMYQPARFASTDIQQFRPRPDYADELAAAFHNPSAREKRDQFCAKLRTVIADAHGQNVIVAQADNVALFLVARRTGSANIEITLLRVARDALAETALRHGLLSLLSEAAQQGGGMVQITDSLLSEPCEVILHELGFRQTGENWEKLALRAMGSTEEVIAAARQSLMEGFITPTDRITAFAFEGAHWPAKILGHDIPTWVVPIRPGWAAQLFETKFAGELLLPPERTLILNRENVYYSGATQSGMSGDGRLLWYTSDDPDQPGSKSIRACSRLLEVRKGAAKRLYHDFQRLGVFAWRDIAEMTSGKPEKVILGIRFSDTELFDQPVSYEVTRTLGIKHNFASPVRIAESQFAEIYRRGIHWRDKA